MLYRPNRPIDRLSIALGKVVPPGTNGMASPPIMQHARVIEVRDKMVVKPGVMAIFEFAFAVMVNGCFVDDDAAVLWLKASPAASRPTVGSRLVGFDEVRCMSYCGRQRSRIQGYYVTLSARCEGEGKFW